MGRPYLEAARGWQPRPLSLPALSCSRNAGPDCLGMERGKQCADQQAVLPSAWAWSQLVHSCNGCWVCCSTSPGGPHKNQRAEAEAVIPPGHEKLCYCHPETFPVCLYICLGAWVSDTLFPQMTDTLQGWAVPRLQVQASNQRHIPKSERISYICLLLPFSFLP